MILRSDLALECKERLAAQTDGVESEQINFKNINITRLCVKNSEAEKAIGKPIGKYVTIETLPFTDTVADECSIESIKTELIRMLPSDGSILVVGLGNESITPDAFGPKTAQKIIATRHIEAEVSKSVGLGELRSVSVITPGVLGKTGIETAEIIKGIVGKVKPGCVVCIDALAGSNLSRLGCTVQIADSGIIPGEGVGNKRSEISKRMLGVPVVAIGVPTVVDAQILAYDLTGNDCSDAVEPRGAGMIVTPKEIDLLIERSSKAVALSINAALQSHLDISIIAELI